MRAGCSMRSRTAPIRRDIKISRATHLMHLEANRDALYRATENFLHGPRHAGRPPDPRGCCRRTPSTPAREIAGYDYGSPRARTRRSRSTSCASSRPGVGWTDQDAIALERAARCCATRPEALVDSWRAEIGRQPHLAKWFFGPDGKPDERYKAAVKQRFVQWVVDACTRPRGPGLARLSRGDRAAPHPGQEEPGPTARTTPDHVPLRYLLGFMGPVIVGTKSFLARCGTSADEVERLHQAWTKNLLLHVALWSRPYVRDGLW